MSHDFPETWDEPSADFERFVSETVRHRIGTYVQPDHPNRVCKEAAENLMRKIQREVGHAVYAGHVTVHASVSACIRVRWGGQGVRQQGHRIHLAATVYLEVHHWLGRLLVYH